VRWFCLPISALALDFAGEIQVSPIVELITNLRRGISPPVHPSCPEHCGAVCCGKHPWLTHREKTGKVGTCLLQPKPTPAKIKTGESSGLLRASPASRDQQAALGAGFGTLGLGFPPAPCAEGTGAVGVWLAPTVDGQGEEAFCTWGLVFENLHSSACELK